VIDDQREGGVTHGDGADLVEPLRRMHHHRNRVALGLRPEPVGGAVGEPGPVGVAMKREPHAEHARLLAPARKQVLVLGVLQREAAHHREPFGMFSRRLERVVVAVSFDRGRHQNGAADTGAIHVGEEGFVAIRRILAAVAQQRAVRPVRRPHMHLRVDDQHPVSCSIGMRSRRNVSRASVRRKLCGCRAGEVRARFGSRRASCGTPFGYRPRCFQPVASHYLSPA
jgi:hypothetical protein